MLRFSYTENRMIIMTNWNTDFQLRDLRMLSVALRERSLTRAAEILDTGRQWLRALSVELFANSAA